jgi:hypothetical protein
MRKRLIYFYLFFIPLCFHFAGCSHLTYFRSFAKKNPFKQRAFFKFVRVATIQVCKPAKFHISCSSRQVKYEGSAFHVHKEGKWSYVLTAAHNIYLDPVHPMHRRMLSAMKYKISVSNDHSYLIDWYKRKHKIVGFKMVKKADLGIVRVKLVKDLPTYRIATEMPQKGEKVYNTASPLGFFSGNVLGLYEGRYLGKKIIPIKGYKSLMAVYTIPVIGGSSGSPILNKCGEVIGIVSSVHRRFHHISFGVPLSAIRSAMYK